MPTFTIETRNAEVEAKDDGAEYADAPAAMAVGVAGAVSIIADEVSRGERSAAVEISVKLPGNIEILRSVVAVSVSALMPTLQIPSKGASAQSADVSIDNLERLELAEAEEIAAATAYRAARTPQSVPLDEAERWSSAMLRVCSALTALRLQRERSARA